MYVRDARNRDEAWLLDHIEAMGLDETAFRSRDYVIAVDDESGTKVGFGRIRVHTGEPELCELTSLGVLESWRGQGVAAHVVERLLRNADIAEFDEVFALAPEPEYLAQLGFRAIDAGDLDERLQERLEAKRAGHDGDVIPMVVDPERFHMPDRLRKRFKDAHEEVVDETPDEEAPEDFGIDPDEATYKYDTG
ncbi:GNAT family N-acetyltransferase [Halorarius halobius]|uniref:GNAT family N-acetyltransferase n=1 Tax=Halorarius halobius TaxID=2962671 RepID=UPI0020CD2676|nr:GNAT family N-acetyltransferase [Halorarius halobius]